MLSLAMERPRPPAQQAVQPHPMTWESPSNTIAPSSLEWASSEAHGGQPRLPELPQGSVSPLQARMSVSGLRAHFAGRLPFPSDFPTHLQGSPPR